MKGVAFSEAQMTFKQQLPGDKDIYIIQLTQWFLALELDRCWNLELFLNFFIFWLCGHK